ncbi:MAG: hypothetical protein U5K37_09585 [Natrialbaceae archaeon]|nr:hypothetical protein [Natrialbaceae archaeon]
MEHPLELNSSRRHVLAGSLLGVMGLTAGCLDTVIPSGDNESDEAEEPEADMTIGASVDRTLEEGDGTDPQRENLADPVTVRNADSRTRVAITMEASVTRPARGPRGTRGRGHC